MTHTKLGRPHRQICTRRVPRGVAWLVTFSTDFSTRARVYISRSSSQLHRRTGGCFFFFFLASCDLSLKTAHITPYVCSIIRQYVWWVCRKRNYTTKKLLRPVKLISGRNTNDFQKSSRVTRFQENVNFFCQVNGYNPTGCVPVFRLSFFVLSNLGS